MIKIDYNAAEKLAVDIKSAHLAIDNALLNISELANSVINVCHASDIPPATSQAAIEHVTMGIGKLVDARKGFVSAHRKIMQVQGTSDLKEINFGCFGESAIITPNLKVVNG